MTTGMITGSFDPITIGHCRIIERAAKMFDRIIVLIVPNGEKGKGAFSNETKLKFAEIAAEDMKTRGIMNVEAVMHNGLTSEIAKQYNVTCYVRGLRNALDFEYEYNLAGVMKRFSPDIDTIFIPDTSETACISSTYVRELLKFNCDLKGSVPDCLCEVMREAYEAERK